MIKIISYLLLIRLRKILPKGDSFAILLFLFFYGVAVYFLNLSYNNYGSYFIYGSVLDVLLYHSNRKDLELLKRHKRVKEILFVEYIIYSLPFLFVYIYHHNFLFVAIQILVTLAILFLEPVLFKSIKYPFNLFNPFWHICFRKYKLLFFVPIVFFLNYVGWQSNNGNLNIATLFVASVFGCIPSFEREELQHIKMSYFESKKYLMEQIKCVLYNASFLSIPIILCFIVLQKWDLLVFVPLIYFFPIVNILFKYSFYYNVLLQQIFFIIFVVNTQSGLSLLVLPFLYYKSFKTIEQIQYA